MLQEFFSLANMGEPKTSKVTLYILVSRIRIARDFGSLCTDPIGFF